MAGHPAGRQGPVPDDRLVVSEAEALGVLAHLVTSAELCMTEPYDYGIFRLIDAASRLGAVLAPGSDAEGRAWLEAFVAEIDAGKMGSVRDRERYGAFLRDASRRVAEHLVERSWSALSSARPEGAAAADPVGRTADTDVG